jgi:hypothetical protein
MNELNERRTRAGQYPDKVILDVYIVLRNGLLLPDSAGRLGWFAAQVVPKM